MARGAAEVAASLRCVGIVLIVLFVLFGVLSIPGIIALVIGSKLVCCQSTAELMKTQVGCLRCGSITGIVFTILEMIGLMIVGIVCLANVENASFLTDICKDYFCDGYDSRYYYCSCDLDRLQNALRAAGAILIVWSLTVGPAAIWAFSTVLCRTTELLQASGGFSGVEIKNGV